jgi:pyruvate/2-oxoglutarate/acetoin dehydrogenase E1 component
MASRQRVAENLNLALGTVLAAHPNAYLLGEDIVDPYGGAFGVTRGLSRRFPDRVLTTPLSEGAIVGVAAGLAFAGDIAVAEMMFSDFVALAFDQLVNFASKSVTMYGRRLPIRMVVRCPTGGRRGYGPTHSQSLQKHFVGVPGLALFEASPFHDNSAVFDAMLELAEPCLFFEDKVLYTTRMSTGPEIDDLFRVEIRGAAPGVAVVSAVDGPADCILIAPGGLAARALGAMRSLLVDRDIACRLLVPSRLYPFDLRPVRELVREARAVCVAEDSSAGGTWGAEIAHQLYETEWASLRRPVRLIHAADSVVPAAPRLERAVLVQETTIRDAVTEALVG